MVGGRKQQVRSAVHDSYAVDVLLLLSEWPDGRGK